MAEKMVFLDSTSSPHANPNIGQISPIDEEFILSIPIPAHGTFVSARPMVEFGNIGVTS